MEVFIKILFMVIIGAIIGGVTNSLAIKMLFRPYNAIYIRNWKVPFTPGLIPKRRDDLAIQLGRLVVNHLITPESFRKKLLNNEFQRDISSFIQKEVQGVLSSDKALEELLESWGVEDSSVKLKTKLHSFLEKKYGEWMDEYRNQTVRDFLSLSLKEKVEGKIPFVSSYIIQKAIDYFSSPEGKSRIEKLVDDFISNRSGMLKNMLQMLLGNVNLADKIQPEIIRFLKNKGTEDLIVNILKNEWEKVLDWNPEKLEEQFEKENIISMGQNVLNKVIKIDHIMNMPMNQLTGAIQEPIMNAIPKGVGMVGEWLSEKIEEIMKRLHLADIVREQVELFPVERIEEMILSIIRKELKMITYLGALLGGIIGIFQGIIATLL